MSVCRRTARPALPALLSLGLLATSPLRAYEVTITDDPAPPHYRDYDYAVDPSDMTLSVSTPAVGDTVTLSAVVRNLALCRAGGAWGHYSPDGRSCWAEWDFCRTNNSNDVVDISFRCQDDVDVHWRIELDGVELASPTVPGVTSQDHWKIVTVHDVPVSPGPHVLFLGTYQMDYYPDYHLDWLQVGDVRIEAETYARMGGNDSDPDLRGLSVWPRDIVVRVTDGPPDGEHTLLWQGPVGDIATITDHHHEHPGYTCEAHCIASAGQAAISADWTPLTPGIHSLFVVVDPDDVLHETDEDNNIAHVDIDVTTVAPMRIEDLGTLGGPQSRALSVNDLGQIVGWAHTADGRAHPFVWLPESACGLPAGMNDLTPDAPTDGCAYDINNNTQVACVTSLYSYYLDPDDQNDFDPNDEISQMGNAAVWLPTPAAGLPAGLTYLNVATPAQAHAINDNLNVAGWSYNSTEHGPYAFKWRPVMGDPNNVIYFDPDPADGGYLPDSWASCALDITNGNDITGRAAYWYFAGGMVAVWDASWTWDAQNREIICESTDFAEPRAVGANGVTVGTSAWSYWRLDPDAAFICDPNCINCTQLPTLGGAQSLATSIDGAGRIVGWAETASGQRHACLWIDGQACDLNDALAPECPWLLIEATDVNEAGTIVGWGRRAGAIHAWRLVARCPEPGLTEHYCSADITGDCRVDLADLSRLLAHYGCTQGCGRADGDIDPPSCCGDGDVDLADLSLLLSQYGDDCN